MMSNLYSFLYQYKYNYLGLDLNVNQLVEGNDHADDYDDALLR